MVYKLISLSVLKLNYRVKIYCFSILNSYYAPTYYLLLSSVHMCGMCMRVYVYVYTYVHVRVHIHIRVHVRTRTCTRTRTPLHTHTHPHPHTHPPQTPSRGTPTSPLTPTTPEDGTLNERIP